MTLVQQSHGERQLYGLLQQQQQRIELVRQRSRSNNHVLVEAGQLELLDESEANSKVAEVFQWMYS